MSGPTGVAIEFPAIEPRAATRGCEFGFQGAANAHAFMVRPGLPCSLAVFLADDLLRMVRDRLQAEAGPDVSADAALLAFAVDAAMALHRSTREAL